MAWRREPRVAFLTHAFSPAMSLNSFQTALQGLHTRTIAVAYSTGVQKSQTSAYPVSMQANKVQCFGDRPLFQTLDITTHCYGGSLPVVTSFLSSHTPQASFLLQHLSKNERSLFKFIFSRQDGFCIRCDFLERRLDGYERVEAMGSFLAPRQEVKAADALPTGPVEDVTSVDLSKAIGIMAVKDQESLHDLEDQLTNRICYPWLSPTSIPHKRIAWVKAKQDLEASERIWQAARALGISVVIIDHPGHWFEPNDTPHSSLREAFIPTDITVDKEFEVRVAHAVRNYGRPIDAVMTVSNERQIGIARVNAMLGLPTAPVEAFEIAANKYTTRAIESDRGGAFLVQSVQDLQGRISGGTKLQYPLIVKPCMGWGSECVSKVDDEEALMHAVGRASGRHQLGAHKRTDVMIEPYIDGPEVDANIVLLDGEIIFMEVGDDFPSAGDLPSSDWQATFQETLMCFPSILPGSEIEAIRNSLAASLRLQGFLTGVFHCEGRVKNSAMEFKTDESGQTELQHKRQSPQSQPSFYLHEINARPPGYLESVAMHLTYGVDYYALMLLQAVDMMDIYRSVSYPYQRGAQWSLVLTVMPEDKAGIMKTADPAKDLLDRVPELRPAVVDCKSMAKKGARLAGLKSSSLNYVAYFSVVSRESRARALELEKWVRREFTYEVE